MKATKMTVLTPTPMMASETATQTLILHQRLLPMPMLMMMLAGQRLQRRHRWLLTEKSQSCSGHRCTDVGAKRSMRLMNTLPLGLPQKQQARQLLPQKMTTKAHPQSRAVQRQMAAAPLTQRQQLQQRVSQES